MIWFFVEQRRHGAWYEVDRFGHPAMAQACVEGLRATWAEGWRFSWWSTHPRGELRVREGEVPASWGEQRVEQPSALKATSAQEEQVVSWGGRAMVVAAIEPEALHLGRRGRVLLRPVSGRGLTRIESLSAFPGLTAAASSRRAA